VIYKEDIEKIRKFLNSDSEELQNLPPTIRESIDNMCSMVEIEIEKQARGNSSHGDVDQWKGFELIPGGF